MMLLRVSDGSQKNYFDKRKFLLYYNNLYINSILTTFYIKTTNEDCLFLEEI